MIKEHVKTGLKYLCYSKKEGKELEKYKGSGKYWVDHLKKHGNDITTQIIFETNDLNEFKKYAVKISNKYDVVNSKSWANLKLEEGDGGNTVSNRIWITNGSENKYILKTDTIPIGWRRGRKCKFNDPEFQKEMSNRVDRKKCGEGIKRAWADGKFDKRDHSKCGVKGNLNPSKRPEVRKKMSEAALKHSKTRSERLKNNPIYHLSSRNKNKI